MGSHRYEDTRGLRVQGDMARPRRDSRQGDTTRRPGGPGGGPVAADRPVLVAPPVPPSVLATHAVLSRSVGPNSETHVDCRPVRPVRQQPPGMGALAQGGHWGLF